MTQVETNANGFVNYDEFLLTGVMRVQEFRKRIKQFQLSVPGIAVDELHQLASKGISMIDVTNSSRKCMAIIK